MSLLGWIVGAALLDEWGRREEEEREKEELRRKNWENDPCDTWEITDATIRVILSSKVGKIPKSILIPCKVKNHIM